VEIICPSCGKDISEFEFSCEKELHTKNRVSTFTDIGFECENCGISVYKYYVEETPPETTEEDDIRDFYKYAGNYDGVFSKEFINRK
jgi:hypothetical protein